MTLNNEELKTCPVHGLYVDLDRSGLCPMCMEDKESEKLDDEMTEENSHSNFMDDFEDDEEEEE